jgi:hypothetical protein
MTRSPSSEHIPAYGLQRPDLAEARAAIERVYGAAAATVWADVVRRAGLDGTTRGDDDLERVIDAMRRSDDPVIHLCAQALSIRHASYRHLASTHDTMVGAA